MKMKDLYEGISPNEDDTCSWDCPCLGLYEESELKKLQRSGEFECVISGVFIEPNKDLCQVLFERMKEKLEEMAEGE